MPAQRNFGLHAKKIPTLAKSGRGWGTRRERMEDCGVVVVEELKENTEDGGTERTEGFGR